MWPMAFRYQQWSLVVPLCPLGFATVPRCPVWFPVVSPLSLVVSRGQPLEGPRGLQNVLPGQFEHAFRTDLMVLKQREILRSASE